MDNFKVLKVYISALETSLAKGFLESHGLHPTFHGAKEYSAHITGLDNGRYELLIPNEEYETAHELLMQQSAPQLVRGDDESGTSPMKKSIYAFLLSLVVVPVLGNIFSMHYLLKAKNSGSPFLRVVLIILNGLIVQAIIWILFLRQVIGHDGF